MRIEFQKHLDMVPKSIILRILLLQVFFSCFAAEPPYDWSKGFELYPGIRHTHLALQEPRLLKINAVRIDLTRPEIQFHSTPRDADWDKAMPDSPEFVIRTRRHRTREYLSQARLSKEEGGNGLNMVLAINASPWRPWVKPFTHTYADHLGLAVSDGVLVCPGNARPSLLIYRDKRVELGQLQPDAAVQNLQIAVSGFAIVLQEGKVSGDSTLHPRTGYGISKDRKYLILLTIDGRQKGWSLGAGSSEVGQWLKHFGAWDGLNMDGGGSTSLAYLVPGENQEMIRLLNQPPGGERRVGSNLGVYLVPAKN